MRVLRTNFQQQVGQWNGAPHYPDLALRIWPRVVVTMTTTSQPGKVLRSARDQRVVAGQDLDDHRIGGYHSS
jgi:hypothetical protein